MNANAKGKRGEREWRDELRSAGFEARRGQQYSGSGDSPDVVCPSLPSIHFEVKRTETLSIYTAMQQAAQDAGHKVPVVAHKRNNRQWLVVMTATDFLDLVRSSDLVAETTGEMDEDDIVRVY